MIRNARIKAEEHHRYIIRAFRNPSSCVVTADAWTAVTYHHEAFDVNPTAVVELNICRSYSFLFCEMMKLRSF